MQNAEDNSFKTECIDCHTDLDCMLHGKVEYQSKVYFSQSESIAIPTIFQKLDVFGLTEVNSLNATLFLIQMSEVCGFVPGMYKQKITQKEDCIKKQHKGNIYIYS